MRVPGWHSPRQMLNCSYSADLTWYDENTPTTVVHIQQEVTLLTRKLNGPTAALVALLLSTLASNSAAATWSVVAGSFPASPRWRRGQVAIHDRLRDRMIVFSGFSISYYPQDLWTLPLSGSSIWSEITPAGTPPPGRSGAAAVYDPIHDRMIVIGGYDGSSNLSDVWALSLAGTPTWTELSPTGTAPSPRLGHTAVYDWRRDRVVLFGGFGPYHRNDVWVLDLTGPVPEWSELTPAGTPPAGRTEHSAIFDDVMDRLIVFGGFDNVNVLNDVWELTLGSSPTWTQLTPTGTPPPSRASHIAAFDRLRDRMIVYGGWNWPNGSSYFDDVWAMSLAGPEAWTQLAPGGTTPASRWDHSGFYDVQNDQLVCFGGGGEGGAFLNDAPFLGGGQVPTAVPSASSAIEGKIAAFPNPFNPSTTLRFKLRRAAHVTLTIYGVNGERTARLVDERLGPGPQTRVWHGRDEAGRAVATGVYFARLNAGGVESTVRMVLVK